MRVEVDTHKCIGSGNCARLAPEVFDQTPDEGVVVLLQDTPGPQLHDPVREAAELCPATAIELTE